MRDKKYIERCLIELNSWLKSRPYWTNIPKRDRISEFFSIRIESETDVHFYPHHVIKVLSTSYEKVGLILEHISPILIKYNIETISLGEKKYKLLNNKYKEIL